MLKPNVGADVAALKPPKLVAVGCVEFCAPNAEADDVVVLKPKGADVAAGAPNTNEMNTQKETFELKEILNGVKNLIFVRAQNVARKNKYSMV